MDTRRRRRLRSSAAPLSTVLVASLVSALVLAGCSGAADIANGTPPSSGQSSGSTEAPTDSPTTGPADLADLPEGFGEGPPGTGLQRFVDQDVSWESCEGGECADIWVPLDYDDPDGLAITLKAKRQTATDDAKRRGSLFINPGGPGESGIEYLGFIGLPDNVQAMYDVVGFDPRGVGEQHAGRLSERLRPRRLHRLRPDTRRRRRRSSSSRTGSPRSPRAASTESGPLVEHVSTVEVARDLDLMRQLVGDKKLNFFGASYGTYIGATYAGLFPKKVGRMVLDGAVDPLADPHKVALHQTAGFQTALDAYLQDCVDKGNCPLGDSVAEGEQTLHRLLQVPRPEPAADLERARPHRGARLPRRHRHAVQQGELALPDAGDAAGAVAVPATRCWRWPTSTTTARPTAPTRGTRPRPTRPSTASTTRRTSRCSRSRATSRSS